MTATSHDATTTGTSSTSSTSGTARTPERGRAGALWVGSLLGAVLTVALLAFIGQNSQQVQLDFLTWNGNVSLAVALIVALVGGALLVAIPAGLRILQLRHQVKKAARS